MSIVSTFRTLRLLLILMVFSRIAPAHSEPGWRFWYASDGMPESFTRRASASPTGRLWFRHGLTKHMTGYDGYRMSSPPEPRMTAEVEWNSEGRVYGRSCGGPTVVDQGMLRELKEGDWVTRKLRTSAQRLVDAVPTANCNLALLYHHALVELDPKTGAERIVKLASASRLGVFKAIVPGFAGEVWIAGTNGVGLWRTSGEGAATSTRGRWSEFLSLSLGAVELDDPLPSEDGTLTVSARARQGHGYMVLSLEADGFHVKARAVKPIRGWKGVDDTFWLLEGTSLWQVFGGVKKKVDRQGALSGIVQDIVIEPRGVFWIATTVGIARYAPPVWRTPPGARDLDTLISAIVEDRQGHIWFSSQSNLVEFDGVRWRTYSLPRDHTVHTTQTNNIAVFADGRIIVPAIGPATQDVMLMFDPATGSWENLVHPSGRRFGLGWKGKDGRYWVRVHSPCSLELFDGRTFTPRPDLPVEPFCGQLRYVAEDASSVWVGSTAAGGGRIEGGALTRFGVSDGYSENGMYAIFDAGNLGVFAGGRESLARFDGRQWHTVRKGIGPVRSFARTREGELWMASGSGIYRRFGGAWIQNGEEEGLPSSIVFSVYEDSRGRVWLGTSRGISLYHPSADVDPPMAEIASELSLGEAPSHGNVKTSLAGYDRWKFNSSDRLFYSHSLDGGKWSDFTESTTLVLQRLAHGRHKLQVRTMDRNGNVGRPSDELSFAVAFPWYKQAGFVLIALSSACIIGLLILFATRQYVDLKKAKLAAETASRCKSEFLANMSHEIRTPMNAILGMAALASEVASTPEQREYLQTVQSSSESLLALLNDILDVSKVEAGKLTLSPHDFDVRSCVESAVKTLTFPARQKGLELVLQVADDVPQFALGDSQRLRQVLLNLLGNAIKFTMEGSVSLTVSSVYKSECWSMLLFRITDTGVGIPDDKQQLIFAPFEQADASTTREFGGTGLGLAISTQLVRLMEGNISVESPWRDQRTGALRQGSAFSFTVRFGVGKAPAASVKVLARAERSQKLRVLLAEDNKVNQKLACKLIEKHGHSVMLANDGVEAVDLFGRSVVDIVFMDIQMPRMDGFEATQAIRAKEAAWKGHVPIIALTAHALSGDRERCLAAGMDGYLTKPIQAAELEALFADYAAESSSPQPRHTLIES